MLYSPFGIPETLRIDPWKRGSGQEGGEEGGEEEQRTSPTKPISAACELWVGLQVLAKRATAVRFTHLKKWALESLCSPRQGFRVTSDQPLDNALNDIVLTS